MFANIKIPKIVVIAILPPTIARLQYPPSRTNNHLQTSAPLMENHHPSNPVKNLRHPLHPLHRPLNPLPPPFIKRVKPTPLAPIEKTPINRNLNGGIGLEVSVGLLED